MAAPSGTTWGSIVGGYGRIGIHVSLSSTATQTTRTTTVWFWSKYSINDSSNKFYYNDEATSATTNRGSVSIHTTSDSGGWSTANQVKIYTATYTFNRGTSNNKKYVAVKLEGIERVGGTMYCNASYTIPALPSYTISYNANGGEGAPGSQTKWYNKNLVLSSSKPNKTGHNFLGWSTTSSGSVEYQPGGTYSNNSNATLYAKWSPYTYSIQYNANGGSNAPSTQTKTYGINLTLSNEKPVRPNYNFLGWSTSPTSGVAYNPGSTYTANSSITLYAVWSLAYAKPRINNFSAERCDSIGTSDEAGTYAKFSMNWNTDREVTEIAIWWKMQADLDWQKETIPATGTNGTITNHIFGNDTLNNEKTYLIQAIVSDNGGTTYSSEITLSTLQLPIDVKVGGTGVAFGKVAERDGVADFGWGILGNWVTEGDHRDTNTSPNDYYYSVRWRGMKQPEAIGLTTTSNFAYVLGLRGWNNHTGGGAHELAFGSNGFIFHRIAKSDTEWHGWHYFITDNMLSTLKVQQAEKADYAARAGYIDNPVFKIWSDQEWIGFYGAGSSSRKGWIGHNATAQLNIVNEAGGDIALNNGKAAVWLSRDNSSYPSYFLPSTKGTMPLGSTTFRWSRLYAAAPCNTSSDRRLKENFIPLDSPLATMIGNNENLFDTIFENLKPMAYSLKKEATEKFFGQMHIGFVAQDVVQALEKAGLSETSAGMVEHSEIVGADGQVFDEYGLCYEEFIALNTHMIQQQQKIINELKTEIAELRKKVG